MFLGVQLDKLFDTFSNASYSLSSKPSVFASALPMFVAFLLYNTIVFHIAI